MPNYVLSRTSPPAHIYERKVNLGYGVKVDTSDAPPPEPNKGKNMNEQVVELADKQADKPAVFADGSVLENGSVNADLIRKQVEAKAAEDVKDGRAAVEG